MYLNKNIILIFVLFIAAIIIFIISWKFLDVWRNNKAKDTKKIKEQNQSASLCLICSSPIVDKEKLISKVYYSDGKTDHLCSIYGCPHCYPHSEDGVKRICPVCGKEMPQGDYLVARLFEYSKTKNHVHVLGCMNCYK